MKIYFPREINSVGSNILALLVHLYKYKKNRTYNNTNAPLNISILFYTWF